MFGMWDAIYAFLARMIGNRTDAADANGSLHAKINNINNATTSILNNAQRPRSTKVPITYSPPNGNFNWNTALNVSGRGRLISVLYKTTLGNTNGIRVTIDGNVIFQNTNIGTIGSATTNYIASDGTPISTSLGFTPMNLDFNQSCKVEVQTTTGANPVTSTCVYELE